jgi:N-methylhydantoinase B
MTQAVEVSYRGGGHWGVSTLIERTRFPGAGLAGGRPGSLGSFRLDSGEQPPAKRLVPLPLDARVNLVLPGGGGYGDPRLRAPEAVLRDVVDGYVSIEAAAREYGLKIRYVGEPDRLVRLPEHYVVDA